MVGVMQVCQPHFNMLVTFLDMTPSCDVLDSAFRIYSKEEYI